MSQPHWSNYYRSGALVTGPPGADGGYDDEIKALWLEVINPLSSGSMILDIGTGNGAIPAIVSASAQSLSTNWTVHGTDLAAIDPVGDVTNGAELFANCHFYPNIASEHLPFDDQAFDLVCGQYALEYADTQAALREVRRVLRPRSWARFVIHHRDSVLLVNAQATLNEIELVRASADLYGKLKVLIDHIGPLRPIDSPEAKALHEAIQKINQGMQQAKPTGTGQTLNVCIETAKNILHVRSQSEDPTDALDALSVATEDLAYSCERLQDLVRVAHDAEQINALIDTAETCGLQSQGHRALFHRQSNLIGWVLDFSQRD